MTRAEPKLNIPRNAHICSHLHASVIYIYESAKMDNARLRETNVLPERIDPRLTKYVLYERIICCSMLIWCLFVLALAIDGLLHGRFFGDWLMMIVSALALVGGPICWTRFFNSQIDARRSTKLLATAARQEARVRFWKRGSGKYTEWFIGVVDAGHVTQQFAVDSAMETKHLHTRNEREFQAGIYQDLSDQRAPVVIEVENELFQCRRSNIPPRLTDRGSGAA